MYLANIIKEIISEQGLDFKEKHRTIYTTCPSCGRDDKLSILKASGGTICYRAACNFGKRSFADWLAQTARITKQQAIDRIFAKPLDRDAGQLEKLTLSLHDEPRDEEQEAEQAVEPTEWPLSHAHDILVPESIEGVGYLNKRGISAELASQYAIAYSSLLRRVILPVMVNSVCYGWQGRAIDPVDGSFRMRNNPGFSRAAMVMFADRLRQSEHAIIAEGPFDALKFHLAGGNVASLGKIISNKQIKLIKSYGVKKIYLALDNDAAIEMRQLSTRFGLPTYHCTVPQTCIDRCARLGVKADFGECTFEECLESFRNAKPLDQSRLVLYLKD